MKKTSLKSGSRRVAKKACAKPFGSTRGSTHRILVNSQNDSKLLEHKKFVNHRKPWTKTHLKELNRFLISKVPFEIMAIKLGRTIEAIKSKTKTLNTKKKITPKRYTPTRRLT